MEEAGLELRPVLTLSVLLLPELQLWTQPQSEPLAASSGWPQEVDKYGQPSSKWAAVVEFLTSSILILNPTHIPDEPNSDPTDKANIYKVLTVCGAL